MDDLITRCIAHIQSIIDQLYADLGAISEDTDTAATREAIQWLEDAVRQYEK